MTREELWRQIAGATSRKELKQLPLTLGAYNPIPDHAQLHELIVSRSKWKCLRFPSAAHMIGAAPSADLDVLMTHWHGDGSTNRREAPVDLGGQLRAERRAQTRLGPALVATMNGYENPYFDWDGEANTWVPNAEHPTLTASFDVVIQIPFVDAWWDAVFTALEAAIKDFQR